MKSYGVTIQTKPLQLYFYMVLFILCVVLTFESVDEILWCDHSNETSSSVLSHDAIYFLCIPACVMRSDFTRKVHVVMKFLPAQFSWIRFKCLGSNFVHSKIHVFQSDRIKRSYCKNFTAHFACRNADLDLIQVAEMIASHAGVFRGARISVLWGGTKYELP